MNERPPLPFARPDPDLRSTPPRAPSGRQPPAGVAAPATRLQLRPLVFAGALVVLLVGALLVLLLQDDARPGQLTEDEVEVLLRSELPEPTALPPLWATPTQPSDLRLTTDPAGAFVQVNSEWVGSTPLDLDDLRPGFYTVTLRGPEHVPLDTSFYLASGSYLHLDVRLEPAAPPVAEREAAPAGRSAPAAQPRRRVEERGRPAGGGAASAPPTFETASPNDLQRIAHTGSISVTSNPPGAEVLIDGEPYGHTPLAVGSLRPKAYVVTLSLPDRLPISYRTEVRAQTVSVVKATFPPPSGR